MNLNRRQVLTGAVALAASPVLGGSSSFDAIKTIPGDGWIPNVWVYPDTGDVADVWSGWIKKIPGTSGALPRDWEHDDFRTNEQRCALVDSLKDPLASTFDTWGNPSAEDMADVLAAEEARYEEQAKRFSEEANGCA